MTSEFGDKSLKLRNKNLPLSLWSSNNSHDMRSAAVGSYVKVSWITHSDSTHELYISKDHKAAKLTVDYSDFGFDYSEQGVLNACSVLKNLSKLSTIESVQLTIENESQFSQKCGSVYTVYSEAETRLLTALKKIKNKKDRHKLVDNFAALRQISAHD